MSAKLLEQTLQQLYSDKVAVAAVSLSDPRIAATELELQALGKTVAARSLEFAAGRTAARCALSGISIQAQDILIGRHRQPLPPAGSLLSISHDDRDAVAVASTQEQWLGLGIDICDADSLAHNLVHSICRGRDLENLAADESERHRAKLVFCLKEALFKAIFPQVCEWMEFSQSELSIDHRNGSYEAVIFSTDGSVLELQGKWFGRFAKAGTRWVAAAGMRRDN